MTKTGLALGAIFATAAIWAPLAQAETYTVLHSLAGTPGGRSEPGGRYGLGCAR